MLSLLIWSPSPLWAYLNTSPCLSSPRCHFSSLFSLTLPSGAGSRGLFASSAIVPCSVSLYLFLCLVLVTGVRSLPMPCLCDWQAAPCLLGGVVFLDVHSSISSPRVWAIRFDVSFRLPHVHVLLKFLSSVLAFIFKGLPLASYLGAVLDNVI